MAKIPGIYVIGDLDTGMSYVGSSVHLPKRLYEHKRGLIRNDHKNQHLQRAFNNGHALVVFPIPTEQDCDVLHLEQKLLDEYCQKGDLYNVMRDVAPTVVGFERSEETRRLMSQRTTEQFQDPDRRQQQSESLKRYFSDTVNREKMIEKVKVATSTTEHREKMATIANKQWSEAEEVRNRYLNTPEDRQQRIDARAHLRKSISVEGVIYNGLLEVQETFKITKATVVGRIKSVKRADWHYMGKENDE